MNEDGDTCKGVLASVQASKHGGQAKRRTENIRGQDISGALFLTEQVVLMFFLHYVVFVIVLLIFLIICLRYFFSWIFFKIHKIQARI